MANAATRCVSILVAACCAASSHAAAQHVVEAPSNAWVTDDSVNAAAVAGATVYISGSFTRIARKTGPLAAIDRASGEALPELPRISGDAATISDLVADGLGGYVIAGAFTSVGGVARQGLARILNGAVDPGFAPTGFDLTGDVAIVGRRVFATVTRRVTPTPVSTVMSFDLLSGQADSWRPAPSDDFSWARLMTGPNDSLLLVAQNVVALDPATGAERWRVPLAGGGPFSDRRLMQREQRTARRGVLSERHWRLHGLGPVASPQAPRSTRAVP